MTRSKDRRPGVRRILYLVHAVPPVEYTGTPLVADQYAAGASKRGMKVAVISGDPSVPDWHAVRDSRTARGFRSFAVPPTDVGTWALLAPSSPRHRRSAANRFFLRVLRRQDPDLLHVVDNVHLPLDWPELAAEAGVPIVRTVSSTEDLCGLVPPVSPNSEAVGFCQAPLSPERCAGCLEAAYGPDFDWPIPPAQRGDRIGWLVERLDAKRARATRQFGSVFDRVTFATAAWRQYFEATLPLDPSKVRVVEMGLDLDRWRPLADKVPPGPGQPVVFALAGSLHPSRGQLDAVQAFSHPKLLGRDDYRLLVLGSGDPDLLGSMVDINPRVEVVGAYQPNELPGHLTRAHVGLSTSLFETFHRVSREYLLAGLPVVANPTFGTEGLVVHGVNGLLYDRTSHDSLVSALVSLLDDRALLARLTNGAATTRTTIRDIGEEMDEIVELYEELVRAKPRRRRRLRRLVPGG